ncbi:MAG: PG0541 family transporter-associated protein [Verrucomicrobiota bacterium]
MIMLVFNEAMNEEVMEVLRHCRLGSYTRLNGIFGKGSASGTHLGTDIWPGRNNSLLMAVDDEATAPLLKCIRELRKTMGSEGIKAFTWNLESVT